MIQKQCTLNNIQDTFQRENLKSSQMFFENLPDLITPQIASLFLKKSVETLYDWNYRGQTRKRKIPSDLFIKLSGGLYLRKDILGKWISNRSSSH